nr:RNA-binding protein MEX3B isoform X2 [Syngnathus scovelli]
MPSSLFADSSVQVDALDDHRALQFASDQFSMLGLGNDDNLLYDDSQELRKKSVNMTKCVPVPSSEHVAEIVGRQGCKIKALRAKTNTYIKTPVRGIEPSPTQPGIFWSQYENQINPSLTGSNSPISTPAIFVATSNGLMVNQRRINKNRSQSRMSPPLHAGTNEYQLAQRVCTDPSKDLFSFPGYVNTVASLTNSHLCCISCDYSSSSSSSSSSTSRKGSRECSVCFESEVIAALVPCGHNLFCMDCANRICEQSEPKCPVCQTSVTQAIRIFS